MKCRHPGCSLKAMIIDTRTTADGAIRRRRQCAHGHSTTTYEQSFDDLPGPSRMLQAKVAELDHRDTRTVLLLVDRLLYLAADDGAA